MRSKRDIDDFFELTYANYLVLPRSVLQQMPKDWQIKFVELLDVLDDTFDWRRNGCWVKFRDRNGKFVNDELSDYRHTNYTAEQIKDIVERHNKKGHPTHDVEK